MRSITVLFAIMSTLVLAEGYYCPYSSLGYDGNNDLLYDYYQSSNNGMYWVRMGQTGWETRQSYCNAKGDTSIHFDAGQAKCEDSQGTCMWDGSCIVNTSKQPDCFELCQTVVNGGGLPCLGNCPNGNVSREQLYDICFNSTPQEPTQTTRQVIVTVLPNKCKV